LGLSSVSLDLCATAGGIAFGTVLLATLQIRGQLREGKLATPVIGARLRTSLAGRGRRGRARDAGLPAAAALNAVAVRRGRRRSRDDGDPQWTRRAQKNRSRVRIARLP